MRMRYLAPFVLSAFFLASCGGSGNSSEKKDTSTSSSEAPVDNSMVKQGAAEAAASKGAGLIAQSDCLTCHKVDMKVVGPAYKEVAAKYEASEANIEMLADKIISGGSGHWGEIPMQAHPNVSKDDAKEMVKYILALK
ncbi:MULTISPECIES: c-type cytochrome [unclassified Chitinophaga]|uniref:c-type cytochrome n=1 Tax=unclassified Chitinophaga TaxID=2619133 RepID=UPI0009C493D1|nr:MULTISPECIES: c-type cytochrome [unclassified Chitinophaga]OMP81294.1 cytochrome C [[Flexibacter] sp. ATCC 35208]WPV67707.1 c-type cytochrome [Chitinophaga sp. LS1]